MSTLPKEPKSINTNTISQLNPPKKDHQQDKQLFNKRKKKQQKKDQQQELQIVISNSQIQFDLQQRQLQTKKLSKKIQKPVKNKQKNKIKVRNKFFNDIQISQNINTTQSSQKNLIQTQIQKTSQPFILQTQLILNKKSKQDFKDTKYSSMIHKTDFLKARHQGKRVDQDIKYKKYVKKKLEQVQDVQQVIIQNFQASVVSRNKFVDSAIFLKNAEKNGLKFNQIVEEKKMTAEEKVKERKLLKTRKYFYEKLNQKIKQTKMSGNQKISLQKNTLNQNQDSIQSKNDKKNKQT